MGVIDLYFVNNVVEVCCRWNVVDCAYITCRPVGPLSLAPIFSSSFCRLLFIGCATSAPDGHKFFGYRLKNINMSAPYIVSCDIFRHNLCLIIHLFSSHYVSPRVHDEVRCAPWHILFHLLHVSMSLIRCRFLIFCLGQNVKARRCTWTLSLRRPI
jgi:hypothetical protein